jgi:hypothetical protein
VEINWDALTPPTPPDRVQQLLTSLATGTYSGPERRRHKRHAVTAPVVALPLAAHYRVDGDPVQMTTANVSLGGAALMHTQCIDAPYLVLDFSVAGEDRLQVVLQVLRVRCVGPLFEIGGQFSGRLSLALT